MSVNNQKNCSICRHNMKPLFGGIAFKCSCGNAYLPDRGFVRLQFNEEIVLRECRVNEMPLFFPAIQRKNGSASDKQEQNVQFLQPEEFLPSGPYQRNANEILKNGIYYVKFNKYFNGHEICKSRPCIVVSNVQHTEYSQIVTVVPLTTKVKLEQGSHVNIRSQATASTAMVEQITTVDVNRVGAFMGQISVNEIMELRTAMERYLGFGNKQSTELEQYANLEAENYALRSQLQEMTNEVSRLQKVKMR